METLRNISGDLVRYYGDGGWVMHWITLCSLLSLTVIVYKLILFHQIRLDLNGFVARVRRALLDGNVREAVQVCEAHRGPIPAILKSGLLKYGKTRGEIEKTMENAAIHEVAHLEQYLIVLATVANIAPLLGFLGTVIGMILSFDAITAQGLNNPAMVARGISVALLTTAWGLIVAFFTQPFYNYFIGKVVACTREIETTCNVFFETLEEMPHERGAVVRVG